MAASVSVLRTQIERIVEPTSFRGTPYAKFQRPEGYFLIDAWFENEKPRMQIRSGADSLEDAATVAVAINMAIEWFVETIAQSKNIPAAKPIPLP